MKKLVVSLCLLLILVGCSESSVKEAVVVMGAPDTHMIESVGSSPVGIQVFEVSHTPTFVELNANVEGDFLIVGITYMLDEERMTRMPEGILYDSWIAYEGLLCNKQTTMMEQLEITMLKGMYFLPIKEYTRVVTIPIDYLIQSGIDLRQSIEIQANINGVRGRTVIVVDAK